MFPPAVYTKDWIARASQKLDKQTNHALMLKCIYALTLLGKLQESGLPFVFKGGTCLLLHLPKIRRLSIDIDIVTGAGADEITAAVNKIGNEEPFSKVVEDDRGERDLPNRRHFKFYFKTASVKEGQTHVLLDVVMEGDIAHDLVRKPIATSFLTPDREILVQVPTIDSLLGDKLNACSPTTTGVPIRKDDGTPGESMQVAKQLFDVGILLEHATDFARISHVYAAIQAQEAKYRKKDIPKVASLNDSFSACLGVSSQGRTTLPIFADTALLLEGFKTLRGHVTWPNFGEAEMLVLTARAAALAAHLRTDRAFDFTTARYTGNAAQLDALRAATLQGHEHAWLDGLKAVNAEAYHYWHMGLTL